FINPTTGVLEPWHPITSDIEAGFGSPLQTGPVQEYALSVRGGTDRVRYYVSGTYGDEEGYVDWNTQTQGTLRANLDLLLRENLDMAFSTNLMQSNTRFGMSPAPYSLPGSFAWGHANRRQTRGHYAARPEDEREIENRALVERST